MEFKDKLVTPREFAEQIGIKRSAVYGLFKRGLLVGIQPTRRGNVRIWLNASIQKLQTSAQQGGQP